MKNHKHYINMAGVFFMAAGIPKDIATKMTAMVAAADTQVDSGVAADRYAGLLSFDIPEDTARQLADHAQAAELTLGIIPDEVRSMVLGQKTRAEAEEQASEDAWNKALAETIQNIDRRKQGLAADASNDAGNTNTQPEPLAA